MTKTVEFKQTTKGHIGLVDGVIVWFIRSEPRLRPNEVWYIYKSEDGGTGFKLMPAKCTRDKDGNIITSEQYGWNTKQATTCTQFSSERFFPCDSPAVESIDDCHVRPHHYR